MNPVSLSELSAAHFAKRNLNGGGFQSEGEAPHKSLRDYAG
jgi:hypothetical protein